MYHSYRSLVRYFRDNLPLPTFISVRRTRLRRGLDGICIYKDGTFTIKVERSLPEYFAVEVLIHEIAHILSWEKNVDSHGPEWGKAYSLVYRKFLQWNEQQTAA